MNYTNYKIYKETEKAILTGWVFTLGGRELTQKVWVPKSVVKEDGVAGWFIEKKLDEIEIMFPQKPFFMGIEEIEITETAEAIA